MSEIERKQREMEHTAIEEMHNSMLHANAAIKAYLSMPDRDRFMEDVLDINDMINVLLRISSKLGSQE